MILQQLGWSYRHLQHMQSMQKAVQLTTFCVKNKKSINVVSFKKCYIVYVICHVFMVDIKI